MHFLGVFQINIEAEKKIEKKTKKNKKKKMVMMNTNSVSIDFYLKKIFKACRSLWNNIDGLSMDLWILRLCMCAL